MAFSGVIKAIKDFVTGTPTDTDYLIFGNTDIKKITFANLRKAFGIDALSSDLKNNLNANNRPLTNSSYYPTSYIYRSGQSVYLRCTGLTVKEVPANSELVIAVEGTLPEEYIPTFQIVRYVPIASDGTLLRVQIDTTGKITYRAPKNLVVGYGINLHLEYMTGKSNF